MYYLYHGGIKMRLYECADSSLQEALIMKYYRYCPRPKSKSLPMSMYQGTSQFKPFCCIKGICNIEKRAEQ